jgi:hypothetical protein
MNKAAMHHPLRFLAFSFVLFAALSLALSAHAQEKKNPAGEQFFIVSSVDQAKSQVLLKRPTEVTLLMKVDGKTQFLDEQGKSLKLTDLRAGDTVWVNSSLAAKDDGPVAVRIRKGPMTVQELHRLYLDYPSSQ